MQSKISRRSIVKGGLIAGALLPTIGLVSRDADAAALPPLDPKDPSAAALHFATDATKVVAASNPTYKPTQKCSNCAQYQGKAGDATRGLQYICRQERACGRLVHGLGSKERLIAATSTGVTVRRGG